MTNICPMSHTEWHNARLHSDRITELNRGVKHQAKMPNAAAPYYATMGFGAEYAFAKLILQKEYHWPTDISKEDFNINGLTIDIKATDWKNGVLFLPDWKIERNKVCDVYVLAYCKPYETPVHFLGWATKEMFKTHGEYKAVKRGNNDKNNMAWHLKPNQLLQDFHGLIHHANDGFVK